MSDWLIAKGKEETLELAYEYIVKECCNWILQLRRMVILITILMHK